VAAGVVARFGIIADVGVGVHALRVVLYVVRTHVLPRERVVVAEIVVQQARLAVEPLARVTVGGGHRSPAIVYGAIGTVVLQRDDLPAVVERHAVTAQRVAHQVVQRGTAHAHCHARTVGVIILRRRHNGASNDRLGVAIKVDGVRRAARAGGMRQHAVALVVVEVLRAAHFARRRRPTRQLAPAVIAQRRPVGCAARAGMPRPRGGVATGHVAHGVVGRVLVGDAAHAGHGVNLIGISIGVAACISSTQMGFDLPPIG